MVKVTVLYPNSRSSRFDVDYYLKVHMPMAIKLLGAPLKGVSVEIGVCGATTDQAPPFAAIVGFTCASVEVFNEALGAHSAQLLGDIPNYTNIEPVIQVGEIRISQ